MARVTIVGSGASGVHFALTLLRKGVEVTLVDVGFRRPDPVSPGIGFDQLKEQLDDPAEYFLGRQFEGVVLPDDESEYYGIPPSKSFVFRHPAGFGYDSTGFSPLFSFARGGLAEAWTGGCYPLNEAELTDFPFSFADLAPCYSEVARRIGVTGTEDDLARFMPLHEHLLEPLRLDSHSSLLLDRYHRKREFLHDRLGVYLGRTRVATLSGERGSRGACWYSGRCLWGCPTGSLYTPSLTLQECRELPGFDYVSGVEAVCFSTGPGGRVRELIVRESGGTTERAMPVDRLALAAGALNSTAIFLESVRRENGEAPRLSGLMDNRQVLMPFVNLRMVGRPFAPESYQYHLLGMGLLTPDPRDYVHCQITTLKTTMMHPVIQSLPFDLRTSTWIARATHAALGLVNVNFRDGRRRSNQVGLRDVEGAPPGQLELEYSPPTDEGSVVRAALSRVRAALRKLGCIVPPGMEHLRPMGASVHYAGSLPMTRQSEPWTTTEFGQSREFENLFVVDGAAFPDLPAKNITFTLMANAVRIAEAAF